jgi:hypothetical protein
MKIIVTRSQVTEVMAFPSVQHLLLSTSINSDALTSEVDVRVASLYNQRNHYPFSGPITIGKSVTLDPTTSPTGASFKCSDKPQWLAEHPLLKCKI